MSFFKGNLLICRGKLEPLPESCTTLRLKADQSFVSGIQRLRQSINKTPPDHHPAAFEIM
jgi:hypothetical protein